MNRFKLTNEYFDHYKTKLDYFLPDGVERIDLDLMHRYDLLNFAPDLIQRSGGEIFDSYFEVEETPEKLTLVNDQFIIWISSDEKSVIPQTLVLIALNRGEEAPHLEVGFKASGVYNNSKLIMKVLEKALLDTQETERLMTLYGHKQT